MNVKASDTSSSQKCCYGPVPEDTASKCIETSTVQSCAEVGATEFDPLIEECPLGYDSFGITGQTTKCCMGQPRAISKSPLSVFNIPPKEKFICYAEGGNSMFAECCWGDECNNKDILVGGFDN